MRFYDDIKLDDAANVRQLEDGRIVAFPRIARTGIQLYLGEEVGLKGKDAKKVIRVYRSEKEVFDKDSLASFLHKPVTNDHPPEPVTPANFSKYARGWTGDEWARDGQFARVPMMLADAALIRDYKDGKRQLSNGYDCDLDWTPGTTPEGEVFDCQQITIRGNHVAVVDAARGGSRLTIGDHREDENPMNDKTTTTITVDNVPLTIDAVSANVIMAHLGRINKATEALQSKLDESEKALEKEKKEKKDALDVAVAKHTTELATKDAKIAELDKAVKDLAITPARLDAMVADRQKVVDVAKVILGDKLVVKDKTIGDVKRQVVSARLGDKAKDWNEIQVDAAFDSITTDVDPSASTAGGGGAPFLDGRPSVYDVARSFAPGTSTQNALDAAYAKRDKDLADAWKGKAA